MYLMVRSPLGWRSWWRLRREVGAEGAFSTSLWIGLVKSRGNLGDRFPGTEDPTCENSKSETSMSGGRSLERRIARQDAGGEPRGRQPRRHARHTHEEHDHERI